MHLAAVMGGGNWPEPRLVQPFVFAAAKVDSCVTVAAMPDMKGYPHPTTWLTCDVPALREAAATIKRAVAMRGFHIRPPGDAEDWERVHRLLIGPSKEILWANVPKLAGCHFQRVLTRAYAYELLLRALHLRPLLPSAQEMKRSQEQLAPRDQEVQQWRAGLWRWRGPRDSGTHAVGTAAAVWWHAERPIRHTRRASTASRRWHLGTSGGLNNTPRPPHHQK